MLIGVTGGNGIFGRILVPYLRSLGHQVTTLGRTGSDICWTLGVYPPVETMVELDALVHCAWSTNDRKKDRHLNVGGSWRLAHIAKICNTPMLFISTIAAESTSAYGKSKLEAEILLARENCTIVRFGLIPRLNTYETRRRYIYPSSSELIHRTSPDKALKYVEEWTKRLGESGSLDTCLTDSITLKKQFKPAGVGLGISLRKIEFVLNIGAPVSLRCRNYLDALESLKKNTVDDNAISY